MCLATFRTDKTLYDSQALQAPIRHDLLHQLMPFFIGMDAVAANQIQTMGLGQESFADRNAGNLVFQCQARDTQGI